MAVYNTPSDAANTAVRSFLTQLGEQYYGGKFNTGSGSGKETWRKIREEEFESKCAYCDAATVKPTIEHLVMFNREQCGLHHPGNIAPCCQGCNKRLRTETKQYTDWDTHLAMVVENNGGSISDLNFRKNRIKEHMKNGSTRNSPRMSLMQSEHLQIPYMLGFRPRSIKVFLFFKN